MSADQNNRNQTTPQRSSAEKLWTVFNVCLTLYLGLALILQDFGELLIPFLVLMWLWWLAGRSVVRNIVPYLSMPQANSSTQQVMHHGATSEAVRIRQVVSQAMRRAGRNPTALPLRLNDIGLLVYESSKQPQIYRTAEVGTDATHIRPFIVIENTEKAVQGIIRFDLIDDRGERRYANRARYVIKPGQTFITPPTWLPLENQQPAGKWLMQVAIGENTLFAVHEFNWFAVGGEVRAQFTGDGEIDELMHNHEPGEALSLDELLVDHGEEAPLVMNSRR